MSKVLIDLKDYQITDTGEVLVKYDALVDMFRTGKIPEGITALPNEDVDLFNMRHPDRAIRIDYADGKQELPDIHSFDFTIPEQYIRMDLDEYLATKLLSHFPDLPDPYMDRLVLELEMMRDREMEDFLRALIYMQDVFDHNGVIHGVGRGSACASLVLFLIGIHMVDPVKYEIPIEEFLR